MAGYKQVIIDALKKHHDSAMAKAKELTVLAQRQATTIEAERFLNQAKEEEAKAKAFLNHAEILSKTNDL